MWHPMTLWEILTTKSGRFHNVLYYICGAVPAFVGVRMLKFMAKRYGMK